MFDFKAAEVRMNIKLDSQDKRIVYLYYITQYSVRQVSAELGCSFDIVKKVLRNTFGMRDKKTSLALRSTPEYIEKIRQTKLGEANPQAKLTEAKVIKIRFAYEQMLLKYKKTEAQEILAEEYGVKRPTISDIVLRNTWKHI